MSEQGSDRAAGVEGDIEQVLGRIEALRDLASELEKAQDDDRVYDFSIRWGATLTGRLERLEHYSRHGGLTPQQQERYEALRAELREALPLADRLRLPRPRIELGVPEHPAPPT